MLSAQSGEDRFGGRRIVLARAGSIISSTAIADITPVDGIIIEIIERALTRRHLGMAAGKLSGPAYVVTRSDPPRLIFVIKPNWEQLGRAQKAGRCAHLSLAHFWLKGTTDLI